MEKKLTLEQFMGTASYYLREMEDEDLDEGVDEEGADDIGTEDEGTEDLGDEGADDLGGDDETGVEDLGGDDGSEDGAVDELEDKSAEDITIKDVSEAVKTLAKHLAITQKKIGGINFNGITFQKQSEVLEALKNVYDSARSFAGEMDAFNALQWK